MSEPTLQPLFGGLNTARVDIAAPAKRVWAILQDRAAWMPHFIAKEPIDGPPDERGERAFWLSRTPNGAIAKRIEEVLYRDPPRRLVTRLAMSDNDATHSFAEWRIAPSPAGCVLEMNLYWLDLPAPGVSDWPGIAAVRDSYVAHTQAVIEPYLATLRSLAEQ